jgi:hypothetical protein
LAEEYRIEGDVDVHEDRKYINVFLTETVRYDRDAVGRPLDRALKGRTVDGQVALGPESEAPAPEDGETEDENAVVVLASGNLGLIYIGSRGRTRWQISGPMSRST